MDLYNNGYVPCYDFDNSCFLASKKGHEVSYQLEYKEFMLLRNLCGTAYSKEGNKLIF